MKIYFKRFMIWVVLSILMTIFWIVSLMIASAMFPSDIIEGAGESTGNTDLWLLLTCFINTGAVLLFNYNSKLRGLKLVSALFLLVFGIQFFMTQIEAVWFDDSLKMGMTTITMITVGGALMSIMFAFTATWLTGKFKPNQNVDASSLSIDLKSMLKPVLLLSVVLWPLVYFIAGHFIAWQFPAIREYYSGSTGIESWFVMMKANILSGLFFFQIFRGFLWVLIAILVLHFTTGSWAKKGLILGLLLSCLACSQLLLPNPIMSEMVRLGHLLETSTSNFLWGFILSGMLARYFSPEDQKFWTGKLINQPAS